MARNSILTEKQEQRIVDRIAEAELRTSGEIRVHLEHHCPGEPLERAENIFHELGMDQTRLQNGVLIYIATEDHKAAVYGGKGIHKKVEEGFWSDVLDILLEHFKKGEYEEGITKAVQVTGDKLSEIYPFDRTDRNELTNEISYKNSLES